jgi:hypothetical protein
VEALLEETGRIIDQEDRIPYDHAVVAAREQMSGEDLERAWQEGRTMSMEQAVDYALQEDAPEVDLEPDIDHEQVAGRR